MTVAFVLLMLGVDRWLSASARRLRSEQLLAIQDWDEDEQTFRRSALLSVMYVLLWSKLDRAIECWALQRKLRLHHPEREWTTAEIDAITAGLVALGYIRPAVVDGRSDDYQWSLTDKGVMKVEHSMGRREEDPDSAVRIQIGADGQVIRSSFDTRDDGDS